MSLIHRNNELLWSMQQNMKTKVTWVIKAQKTSILFICKNDPGHGISGHQNKLTDSDWVKEEKRKHFI